MPKPTARGIQYPIPDDYVKQPGTPSKLAQDFQVMATTTDAAIGTEGARAQQAATQAAINDANSKYGGLPGRVNHVEAHNTTQDTQINNQNTRLWAVERLGGLAPGDVSDATMTSIAANPESTFHSQQVERISDSTGTVNATDHANFETALALAHTTGRTLVVDSDIEADTVPRSFFEVPVAGKGSITVGGNKWWANPHHLGIQTNTLYLNPTTGSDQNSGLDPNAPIKSFNRLNIVMSMLREKLLDGFWEVVIQEGHHMVDAGWDMRGLRTKWALTIRGEGSTETIIDGGESTTGSAFRFLNAQTEINIRDLGIRNYVEASTNDGYDTSAGIVFHGPGQIRIEDCEVLDSKTSIRAGYGATVAVYNTTIKGSEARSLNGTVATGIALTYGASATIGASGGLGNTITHCGTGVSVSRNSVAHVDYNVFEDNYYGIQGSHNARVAVITDDFRRNMVGIGLSGGAELTYSTAVYGVGVDANLEANLRVGGAARLSSFTGAPTAAVEYRVGSIVNEEPETTPENTSRNAVVVFKSHGAIPENTLLGAGKKIRAVLYADSNGSTGQRRFQLSKNSRQSTNHQVLSSLVVPSDLGWGVFKIEFTAETTDTPGTFVWTSEIVATGYTQQTNGVLHGLDLTHDWMFRIYQQNLDNAGDTISIRKAELYVTG